LLRFHSPSFSTNANPTPHKVGVFHRRAQETRGTLMPRAVESHFPNIEEPASIASNFQRPSCDTLSLENSTTHSFKCLIRCLFSCPPGGTEQKRKGTEVSVCQFISLASLPLRSLHNSKPPKCPNTPAPSHATTQRSDHHEFPRAPRRSAVSLAGAWQCGLCPVWRNTRQVMVFRLTVCHDD